jgi:hypothetical protein
MVGRPARPAASAASLRRVTTSPSGKVSIEQVSAHERRCGPRRRAPRPGALEHAASKTAQLLTEGWSDNCQSAISGPTAPKLAYYASPRFCPAAGQPCYRREARSEPDPGQLLSSSRHLVSRDRVGDEAAAPDDTVACPELSGSGSALVQLSGSSARCSSSEQSRTQDLVCRLPTVRRAAGIGGSMRSANSYASSSA